MITSQQAQDIVLNHCHSTPYAEQFVIYFCELSPKQDFWIIRCNSEGYVIYNQLEHCYIGVNAYLVDTFTGKINIVSSGESVEDFLQEIYDTQTACGQFYLLRPTFSKENKISLLHLKQWIGCGYIDAINLLTINKNWFTGKRRYLQHIQILLDKRDIKTEIILADKIDNIVVINNGTWFEEDIKKELRTVIGNGI
ncbi:MAG TPA: hypothetical protein DIS95_09510 [Proteus vulgaris]|uniref:Uncharacterized protein n=1 Tax=Proteus vulgaris TaxID=585 RepID=A0A379FDL2_PROVU|nr:hypothetical protein [Proteus vulgaris]UBH60464.1 hypothetical protein LA322_10020 [Proteus vulgaris]UWU01733.1 hypothetical protein N1711_07535 [Proteus vulgaris]SUC17582.1 Uncharacterised protein [Proteus vulgaris]VTP85659.1 Uncharacterised protein [Proteus vulgaris]HCN42627.1 hypothetical protein [Proteus vulgaris]